MKTCKPLHLTVKCRCSNSLSEVILLINIIIINKPDIIIHDNEKGTCMLIDVAISGDRNVIKKRSPEDSKI